MKYNEKKKLQTAMRRLYSTTLPCKEISTLLGVDRLEFKNHVNRFLLDGMTMDNFGKIWGLDHIVPVDLFDLSNIDDKKLCYNFINIMPMFNNDNRLKGASIHFSLEKLNHLKTVVDNLSASDPMYTNVYINKLIERCEVNKQLVYQKYLI